MVGRVRESGHLTVDQITTCKDSGFSRGNTRERIETFSQVHVFRRIVRFSRGNTRERIETESRRLQVGYP